MIVERPSPHIRRVHRLDQIPTGDRRQTLIHGKLQLPGAEVTEAVNAREPQPRRVLEPVGEHVCAPLGRGAIRVGQDELHPGGGVFEAELDADPQHLPVLDEVLGFDGDVDDQLASAVLWVGRIDGLVVRARERLQVAADGERAG